MVVAVLTFGRVASALMALIVVSALYMSPAVDSLGSNAVREELVYVDVAKIIYSSGAPEGYFESPINYSEPHYVQVVRPVMAGGDVTAERSGNTTLFKLSTAENASGYVILNVSLTRDPCKELSTVAYALYELNVTELPVEALICLLSADYELSNLSSKTYPEDVASTYIRQPDRRVVDKVVPMFEEWLSGRLHTNYSIASVPKTYIAIWASYYIYGGHLIKYEASSIPRTLDEVLEERKGDCDDMSRILLNMLWYYGVPAKMQYGYVYIDTFDYLSDVYGSLTRFINAGPHAYVVIYVPDVGWVSVDLLAWARLIHPTLITGESTYANVSAEDIKAIENEYSAFKYIELVEVHKANMIPSTLAEAINSGDLYRRLEELVKWTPQTAENITVTLTPTSTTTTETTRLSTQSETSITTRNTDPGLESTPVVLMLAALLILLLAILAKHKIAYIVL